MNLTAQKATLFKKVQDKKRLREGWKVWTTDGKIFFKPDLTSNAIRINADEARKRDCEAAVLNRGPYMLSEEFKSL